MQIHKKKICFFIGYILWVLSSSYFVTINKDLYNIIKMISLVLFIISILTTKWKLKEFIKSFFMIGICLLVYFNNNEIEFLLLPILLLASKNTNIYEIANVDLPVRMLGILMTISSYLMGIINGNNIISDSSFLKYRYSLGYYHPNNLFAQIFLICIDILLCYNKKLKFKHYVLLIIFECIFGLITYSRTGMILLGMLILLIILFKNNINNKKLLLIFIKYCFIICFIISIAGSYLFSINNTTIQEIDRAISGRFSFASRFISEYGINLFGTKISYMSTLDSSVSGSLAIVLDNLYVYLLVSGGLVFTVLFLYLITKQQKILIEKKEYILAIIIFVYAIYSITEKVYFSPNNNYLLMLLFCALTNNVTYINERKEEEKQIG